MRVLVIEDEPGLRQSLSTQLRSAGYAVDATGSGVEGAYMGSEFPVDLAVVDLGLPDLSGIDVIRGWRTQGRELPVLILTARGRWQDKVEGLEAGADGYLVKPFHMEECLARMRALSRRARGWSSPELRCGPIVLEPGPQQVTVHDQPVQLTGYEYRLLEYLMLHAGEVVSKQRLTEHCYDDDQDRDSNVLEVLLGRLRRKLDPDARLKPIETLRGRGYRLTYGRGPAG